MSDLEQKGGTNQSNLVWFIIGFQGSWRQSTRLTDLWVVLNMPDRYNIVIIHLLCELFVWDACCIITTGGYYLSACFYLEIFEKYIASINNSQGDDKQNGVWAAQGCFVFAGCIPPHISAHYS